MRSTPSPALAIGIPLLLAYHAPGLMGQPTPTPPTQPTPPSPPSPPFSGPPTFSFPTDYPGYPGYRSGSWLPPSVVPTVTIVPTDVTVVPTFPVITYTITTDGAIVTFVSLLPSSSGETQATLTSGSAIADIRLSSTVTQCEPFLIYYDLPVQSDSYDLVFQTPDGQNFLSVRLPSGKGYMDWICDIPAGYRFYVTGPIAEYYTVQANSFSACLRNITASYIYAQYNTNIFQSYTAHPPNTTPPPSSFHASPIIPFPASSLSTITVNPDIPFVSPPATHSSLISPVIVSSSATPPLNAAHKSNKFAIAGGVGGALFVMLCTLVAFILLLRRKHEKRKAIVHPTFLKRTKHTGSESGSQVFMVEAKKGSLPRGPSTPTPPVPGLEPEISLAVAEPGGKRSLTHPNNDTAISTNALLLTRQASGAEAPSSLSAAMDIISRLCPSAREREMLIQSLHNSLNRPPGSSVVVESSAIPWSNNDPPNLQMIVESFSRLDDWERTAILMALGHMVTPESHTLGPDSSGILEPPPPPYGGYVNTRRDSIEEGLRNNSVDITIHKGSESDMS